MRFKIVIPSYNCFEWLPRCLDSVANQEGDFDVIVIDDASTDARQAPYIKDYCERSGWQYILNDVNVKCPYNIWVGVHALSPNFGDVVVLVDGDDYLPHSGVLNRLARSYSNPEVFLTYGQYDPRDANGALHYTGQIQASDVPEEVRRDRSFRSYFSPWFNHLVSFRFFLFDAIPLDQMKMPDGSWLLAGYDKAIIIPMMEMASPYYEFIDEVLYCYNSVNPLSDSIANRDLCLQSDVVYSKPKLAPLNHAAIIERLKSDTGLA